MSSERPSWLMRVLVSVVGALGVMHAALSNPTRFIPGHPLGDGPKHVWSYWHLPATASGWPWTDLLNAPAGGILLDPMAQPAALLAPLTHWVSPALSANVWIGAMLTAAALGVARLARELGASERGAILAAALTPLAQPMLAYPIASGVHERLGVALLPWLAAALVHRARTGTGGWVPALLLAPLALHSGVWAWVGTLLLVAGLMVPRRVSLGRFLRPWAVGLALLGGAFLLSRGWSTDPMSLAPQPGRHGLFGPGGAVVRAATPASLWWPQSPTFLEEGDLLCRGEFLGLGGTLLALYGLIRRRDRLTVWAALGLGVLVVWSLGPWPLGRLNPVYALSVWVVPLLGAWPEPGQLTIPGVLLLTAMVGASWSQVTGRSTRWALVLLLVGERLLALPDLSLRTDTSPDAVFGQLPEAGVVVTIPRDLPDRRLTPGTPFLAQMVHQQPISASVFPGVSLWDDWQPVKTGESEDWSTVADCLRRGGMRFVALRVALLDDAEETTRGLARGGGAVVASSAAWIVLDLGQTAEAPSLVPPFRPQGAAPLAEGWLPPVPLPVGTHTVLRSSETCPVDRISRQKGQPASG